MDGWLWAVLAGLVLTVEAWALWVPDDWLRPLTYHVRRIFGLRSGWRSPGWWMLGGFIAWLGFHFLVER